MIFFFFFFLSLVDDIELYLLISSLKISFDVKVQTCTLQISILKVKLDFNLRANCKPGPRIKKKICQEQGCVQLTETFAAPRKLLQTIL